MASVSFLEQSESSIVTSKEEICLLSPPTDVQFVTAVGTRVVMPVAIVSTFLFTLVLG